MLRGFRPEVEGVAGAAALEAVECVPVEVGGEAAGDAGVRAVQRTRPALLAAVGRVGLEAEQLQDGRDVDHRAHGGEVDGGSRRGGLGLGGWCRRIVAFGLADLLPTFAGLVQLAVALREDRDFATFELVLGCDVLDGGVQPDGVVMSGVLAHNLAGVVERQRNQSANAFSLDGFEPAFDLAVGLRLIRRRFNMR